MGFGAAGPTGKFSLTERQVKCTVIEGGRSDRGEQVLWAQFGVSRLQHDRDQLVRLYEPFARSIAARVYQGRMDDSVPFEDYFQYARVGLIEAVDRYEYERGVPFSFFSSSRIRGAILNGIGKESELAAQIRFWRVQGRERIGSLTAEVIVDKIDTASLDDIAEVTVGLAVGALLEGVVESYESIESDRSSDPYAVNEFSQLLKTTKRLIEQLPSREKIVITNHYIKRMDFRQIALQMSLSKGRISQIHAQAILRLRGWLEDRPRVDRRL